MASNDINDIKMPSETTVRPTLEAEALAAELVHEAGDEIPHLDLDVLFAILEEQQSTDADAAMATTVTGGPAADEAAAVVNDFSIVLLDQDPTKPDLASSNGTDEGGV